MKVAIFDFDDVLCLWKLNAIQKSEYETKLRLWLETLHTKGVHLCVASFNHKASQLCDQMGISKFFSHICADNRQVEKTGMLSWIMEQYPHIAPIDFMFYDDNYDNVLDARKLGMRATCVAPRTDLKIIQSWIPALYGMFNFDSKGNVVSICNVDPMDRRIIIDQLYTLPVLLKGKEGVTAAFIQRITQLQHTRVK